MEYLAIHQEAMYRIAQRSGRHRRTLVTLADGRLAPGVKKQMVKTKHKLLTDSWTADVEVLETGIGRFTEDRAHANDCEVVFFEIDGDGRLHVNVTHRHQTTTVAGWAGPASLREGFVHNRTFGDTPPGQLLRAIRDMVLAKRL